MPMYVNNEVGDIVLRGESKRLIICKVNEPVELSPADIAAAKSTKAGALHFARLKPPIAGTVPSREQPEREAEDKRRALAETAAHFARLKPPIAGTVPSRERPEREAEDKRRALAETAAREAAAAEGAAPSAPASDEPPAADAPPSAPARRGGRQ